MVRVGKLGKTTWGAANNIVLPAMIRTRAFFKLKMAFVGATIAPQSIIPPVDFRHYIRSFQK
jgi:hypothetical protein